MIVLSIVVFMFDSKLTDTSNHTYSISNQQKKKKKYNTIEIDASEALKNQHFSYRIRSQFNPVNSVIHLRMFWMIVNPQTH